MCWDNWFDLFDNSSRHSFNHLGRFYNYRICLYRYHLCNHRNFLCRGYMPNFSVSDSDCRSNIRHYVSGWRIVGLHDRRVIDWLWGMHNYLLRNYLNWRVSDHRTQNYLRSLVVHYRRCVSWLHESSLGRSIDSRWTCVDRVVSSNMSSWVVCRLLISVDWSCMNLSWAVRNSLIDWASRPVVSPIQRCAICYRSAFEVVSAVSSDLRKSVMNAILGNHPIAWAS